MSAFDPTQTSRRVVRAVGMSDDGYRGYRSLPVKWGSLHASAARSTLGASTMDRSFDLNIFTILFLTGTFLAALVAGLGGFAFGIVGAAIWLYILTPLQTATLIMGLGLVVQGYSVWKLRHALSWRRLSPLLVGTALGVPLGVFMLAHADPHYLRLGIGAVLVLFSLYGLWRPTIKPTKADAMAGDLGAGFLNGVLGGATGLAGIVTVIWCQLRGWTKDQQRAVFQPVG